MISKNDEKFLWEKHVFDSLGIEKFFDKYDAVLMANHGFIVGAKTMEDAYLKLELAESYAQVVLNTEILGGAKHLTQEQTTEILELRKKL